MTTETTPAMQEVQQGMSEEAAASELLKRWGASEEAPAEQTTEETTEEAQAEEATAQAKEETEEESAESEEVEIDVAGEKYKLPAKAAEVAKTVEAKVKEIEAGATRKFQEAADSRKLADTQLVHAKQIGELSQQEVELIADLRTIDRRLQQIMNVDASQLDPAQVATLTHEAQRLQFIRGQAETQLQDARTQKKAKLDESTAARFQHLNEWSKKNIKGWSDEYSQTLLEFSVKELGADLTALRDVMSEPVLKALDLAYKGWKVQQADPKAKQVVTTKTLKPGAAGQTKSSAQQAVETANRRFGQTKKVDDAAQALLARMNAKKR